MIALNCQRLRLKKRVPLAISRGTQSESQMVWLRLSADGTEGWGEAGEFSVGSIQETLQDIETGLEAARSRLEQADPFARESIEDSLVLACTSSAARAAVNQALWDWFGRRTGQPVWKLLGLSPADSPVTSVTLGIMSPEAAVKRLEQWLEVGEIRAFKVKLGSPDGIKADQHMFEAVHAALPTGTKVSVDANGGWQPDEAISMSAWLADRGVDHVEQPLARGRERELQFVHKRSALPIIVDESCFTSRDIPALAGVADGINIKLMKCGGISEAIRMIHAARAHGLQTMLGCYGNSSLSNSAAAHLGPLVDHLDLDSHLNLSDDPFTGVRFAHGRLELPDEPGFGVRHESAH